MARRRERHGVGRVAHLGLDVEQLEDAIEADGDVLRPRPEYEQPLDRLGAHAEGGLREAEQAEVPGAEAGRQQQSLRGQRGALLRAQGCDAGGGEDRGRDQREAEHAERREEAARAEGRSEGLARADFEARLLAGLGAEGLDHANAGECLLDVRGQRAVASARLAEAAAQSRREQRGEQQRGWPREQQQQREARIEQRDQRRRGHEPQELRERREHHGLDQIRHHRAVLIEAIDGVADAAVVVEAQREGLQALEELEAELLVDALEDPEQVVGEGAAERSQQPA